MSSTTQSLLDSLDIDALLPEEQEALLLDLGDLIQKGTLARLIERMDESTQASFNDLLDGNPSEEEMDAFLAEQVPGAATARQETIDELQNDILAITGSGQD